MAEEKFQVQEVVTDTERVLVLDGKQVDSLELLGKIANVLVGEGILKLEEKK